MASKNKVAVSSPVDRIAELSASLARLREQADLILAAPRALSEATGDIARVIEQLAERFDPPVWFLANGPAGVGDLVHALSSRNQNEYQQPSPGEFLAWAQPEALAAALERSLVASYEAMPVPMDAATKAAELKRLRTEIGRLEIELVAVWWGAIDGGMALPPPDVDGATLIGLSPL